MSYKLHIGDVLGKASRKWKGQTGIIEFGIDPQAGCQVGFISCDRLHGSIILMGVCFDVALKAGRAANSPRKMVVAL
jgi:hypothetical protein